jgi:hypothetical protein
MLDLRQLGDGVNRGGCNEKDEQRDALVHYVAPD